MSSTIDHELEKLKLLFDYTKFHIGLYTTLGTGLTAVLAADFAEAWHVDRGLLGVAIVSIAVAGFAGGVVTSTLTQHTSHHDFWTQPTGPFRFKWWTGETFTYIEHSAFWLAVAAGLLAVGFGSR
jgi:hypothetical protein